MSVCDLNGAIEQQQQHGYIRTAESRCVGQLGDYRVSEGYRKMSFTGRFAQQERGGHGFVRAPILLL